MCQSHNLTYLCQLLTGATANDVSAGGLISASQCARGDLSCVVIVPIDTPQGIGSLGAATVGSLSESAVRPRINPAPKRIVSPGSGKPMLFRNTTTKTSTYP